MHSWQVVAVSLATQCVCNHIRLSWVTMHFQLIVLDQFYPSSLPHIQIWLGKDILQTFLVCIDVNHIPEQIMSPRPQCHHHGCQLKIMSWIIFLVASQLSREFTRPSCIRTHPIPVPEASQYTSKGLAMSGCASTGDVVSNFFKVLKASSKSLLHTYLLPFFNSSVMGYEILEKFGMNLR
jgi:hypothetical protein